VGQISTDQSHQVMAALATNCEWTGIDFQASGLQDLVIRNQKEAGRQFAAFLRNGCRLLIETFFRETGELSITIPALPRPTFAELRSKHDWIRKENGIERDTSPTEAVTLKLATVLRESEGSINGPEYEKRIAQKLDIILGYQQAVWLVEHQDEFPEFMALLGKVYIDFTGLVVVNANGNRHFPYLSQDGKRWYLGWDWIDDNFGSSERVASFSK
jgi:hypothetical protein